MMGHPARCGQAEDDAPQLIRQGVDEWRAIQPAAGRVKMMHPARCGQGVDEWWATPPTVGRVKMMHPALLGRVLMNGGPPRPLWAG